MDSQVNESIGTFEFVSKSFSISVEYTSHDFYLYFKNSNMTVNKLKPYLCDSTHEHNIVQFCTSAYPDGYYVFDTNETVNGSKKFAEVLNDEVVNCIYVVPILNEKNGRDGRDGGDCFDVAFNYVKNFFNINNK
jgi:hypothetical protein